MLKIVCIVLLLDSALRILAASPTKSDNNHPSSSHHNRSLSSDHSDHSGTSTPRSYHSTASSFNSPERSRSPKRRHEEIIWHDKEIVERHDQLGWHDKHISRDKHIVHSHNPVHSSSSSSTNTRPQINEVSTLSAGHLTRSLPTSPAPTSSMHASTSRTPGISSSVRGRERGITIRTLNSPRQRATNSQINHHNTIEQYNTSTRAQSPSSGHNILPSSSDQDHDRFWRVYHLMSEATRRVPVNQSSQNHQEHQTENHSSRPNLPVSPSNHRRTQLRQSAPNSPQTASNSRTSHVATNSRQRRESMWDSFSDERR